MPKFSWERFGLKGLTNAKSAMELEMSHKKPRIVEEMTGYEKISGESDGWIAPEKVERGIVWCNP
jgi:hypothetical protein